MEGIKPPRPHDLMGNPDVAPPRRDHHQRSRRRHVLRQAEP
jgi:hypothetical protein